MYSKIKWILFNLDSAIDHERLQAIHQAAECTDPRVLQALVGIANSDPSLEHRHVARRSIALIRDRISENVASIDGSGIIEAGKIREYLQSKDPASRVKALQALAAFEMPDKDKLMTVLVQREKDPFVRSELVKNLVVLGSAGLPLILEFLSETDSRIKLNALEALDALGTNEAFKHIVPQLLDTDERVRQAATSALNRCGRSRLLDVLAAMLDEAEAPFRDAAVHALALVRLPEALPLLRKALSDPVEGIRRKASEGLELLAQGGVSEADEVLEEFQQSSETPASAPAPSTVAATIERGEMLEPVTQLNLLEDFDPTNRLAEIKKVVRMKAYERAAELAARIKVERDRNVLSCLVLALGRLKAREYVPVIRRHLRSDNDRVRANAVEALGLIGDRSFQAELVPFLDDPNNRVKVNAILALKSYPGVAAHTLLADCLGAADQALRRSALYGLLELQDDEAVGMFARALEDPDAIVRETAMEYLAILKSEGNALAAKLFDQAHARGLRPPATGGSISRTARGSRLPKYTLDELLYYLKEIGGSDLHINVGTEACVRLHGSIRRIRSVPLTADDTKRMIYAVLNDDQIVKLEKNYSLDFSYTIAGVARFRVNAFREARGYKGVFRLVPMDLPTIDGLSLPPLFKQMCHLHQGLVLLTGPTGSGKSTTLAAMINEVNSTEQKHIITIEDPIEFVHPHRLSIVSQRELGVHAHSFAGALRDALREDPNVILLGEMRDLDTMSLAVTAAETGHLVFSTLHTYSAGQSINRIVDVFPPNQQEQARAQLSTTIQAIVSQRLVPAATGDSRVLALEVMVNTPAISNLIREGKTEQIYTVIQVSHEAGMMTLDSHLAQLVSQGKIARSVALDFAIDKKSLLSSLK